MVLLNSLDHERKRRALLAHAYAACAPCSGLGCIADFFTGGCTPDTTPQPTGQNITPSQIPTTPGKLPANTLDTQGACQFWDLSCYLRSKNLGPSLCPPLCGSKCGPIPLPCWALVVIGIVIVVLVVVLKRR